MQFQIFTLDEATQALPVLTSMIDQVRARRHELIRVLVDLDELHARQAQQGHTIELMQRMQARKTEVDRLRKELAALNHSVRDMGVVVRDYDEGLADFPAIIDGQPGYLCWKAGEDEISFWHGPEEGFAGRRPLRKAST